MLNYLKIYLKISIFNYNLKFGVEKALSVLIVVDVYLEICHVNDKFLYCFFEEGMTWRRMASLRLRWSQFKRGRSGNIQPLEMAGKDRMKRTANNEDKVMMMMMVVMFLFIEKNKEILHRICCQQRRVKTGKTERIKPRRGKTFLEVK